MNILIVGSGAREHALTKAFARSPQHPKLFCFGSSTNPGIKELTKEYTIGKLDDTEAILTCAQTNTIDFVFIGSELPLSAGLANVLQSNNIPCIGPTKELARIETSKAFARDLLSFHNVPGLPNYKRFDYSESPETITNYIQSLNEKYVIKADGLMSGKGVKVYGEHLHSLEDSLAFIQEITETKSAFVIEEKFVGQEFSLMSFSDGVHLTHMPAVQDHKRAYVGDTGPNTGGMGTYSDTNHSLPFLTEHDIAEAQKINELTLAALRANGDRRYKGILYGGFMATKEGVKLIEYNARFGDPESINVLALLKTNLVTICEHIIAGTLDQIDVEWENLATVCKYAVPEGYPDKPIKNQLIDISEITNPDYLFYAGVDVKDGKLYETGSRTVAVLSTGNTIAEAEQIAEVEINKIKGPLFHREDIGTEKLIKQKIEQIKKIRN